jgi:hypothetical protein
MLGAAELFPKVQARFSQCCRRARNHAFPSDAVDRCTCARSTAEIFRPTARTASLRLATRPIRCWPVKCAARIQCGRETRRLPSGRRSPRRRQTPRCLCADTTSWEQRARRPQGSRAVGDGALPEPRRPSGQKSVCFGCVGSAADLASAISRACTVCAGSIVSEHGCPAFVPTSVR